MTIPRKKKEATKTNTIKVCVSDSTKELLLKAAATEHRTLSNMVELLIIKYAPQIIASAPPPYDALADVIGD